MTHDLHVERLIDATCEEAFDAFLAEDAIKEWYQLEDSWQVTVVASDGRVGGNTIVEFGDPNVGWKCREDITYTALDRPHRIVFSQNFAGGTGDETIDFDTVVTVTFEDRDGKTLVTLAETGYPNGEIRDQHQNGWPTFLENLGRVAVARRQVA